MPYIKDKNACELTADRHAEITEQTEAPRDAGCVHGVAGEGIHESWVGLHRYDEVYEEAINGSK